MYPDTVYISTVQCTTVQVVPRYSIRRYACGTTLATRVRRRLPRSLAGGYTVQAVACLACQMACLACHPGLPGLGTLYSTRYNNQYSVQVQYNCTAVESKE